MATDVVDTNIITEVQYIVSANFERGLTAKSSGTHIPTEYCHMFRLAGDHTFMPKNAVTISQVLKVAAASIGEDDDRVYLATPTSKDLTGLDSSHQAETKSYGEKGYEGTDKGIYVIVRVRNGNPALDMVRAREEEQTAARDRIVKFLVKNQLMADSAHVH
jgi:hypothetical protein